MKDMMILRVVAKLLIPFIMLFGLYVQFHGDYGPGGGFQAGVIFAAAFILYGLVFDVESAKRIIPPNILAGLASLGVLVYGGVGVATLFLGGEFLNYNVLSDDPVAGQHLGILVIELGVGVTVASTMMLLFFTFASCVPQSITKDTGKGDDGS